MSARQSSQPTGRGPVRASSSNISRSKLASDCDRPGAVLSNFHTSSGGRLGADGWSAACRTSRHSAASRISRRSSGSVRRNKSGEIVGGRGMSNAPMKSPGIPLRGQRGGQHRREFRTARREDHAPGNGAHVAALVLQRVRDTCPRARIGHVLDKQRNAAGRHRRLQQRVEIDRGIGHVRHHRRSCHHRKDGDHRPRQPCVKSADHVRSSFSVLLSCDRSVLRRSNCYLRRVKRTSMYIVRDICDPSTGAVSNCHFDTAMSALRPRP